MLMVEGYLASGPDAGAGSQRPQLMIHLDQDVLGADGALAATLDDGTRIPAETLRRVACDAGLVPAITDSRGEVLDIGRRSRAIPPAIKRALWLRDRGCRFPGCTNTRFVHGHHIQHWIAGGKTRLENLVLLCSAHHRLVHEGGYTIERAADGSAPGNGQLSFRAPSSALIPAVPQREAIEDAVISLQQWARDRDIEIGPDTNLPWWDGAVPDYDMAVTGLLPV
jgi:hypothetical protein